VSYGSSPCGLCGAALEWNALPDGFKLRYGHGLEIVRVLGRGGFGVTYLADQLRSSLGGRRVAIKECFPDGLVIRDSSGQVIAKPGCETEFADLLQRFLLEARLLNQIRHPVSTEFLACWQANNTAYLMMEFIDGETLEARIAKGSRLSEFEAVALLEPILDLLEGVHGKQLLHRDIKPANIMLTKDGVELIDFGSVIKFDPQRNTKISSKILTPAYAPLELYGSQVRLGPSSDLYSLAASVYEAMTGVRVPSALDRSNGAMVQPLEAVLNSVSREFSKLIARALELRIDDRFETAQKMRAALRGVPVYSNPVSRVIANVPVATAGRTGFRVPPWARVVLAMVALIFGINRFLVFRAWQADLENTRLAREAFIADQCEMLEKDISNSFTCSVRVQSSDNRQVVLRASLVDLLIRRDGGSVRNLRSDPEFVDFVYELAGNALDLYGVDVVQFEAFSDPSAKKFLAQFSIDRTDIAEHSKRPVKARLAELRVARAKKRLTMPSNETFLQLVGRREIENSEFGQKWGLKINSLTWNTDTFPLQSSEGNGATLFVEIPGDDDILGKDVLMLARDSAFRLGLRDMIVRLHRALSDAPYIAVFVGKRESSSVWSVSAASHSDNEFVQLAKASNVQLDDIWSFSSEYLPPIAEGYPAEYNAVNAYVIPLEMRQADAPISVSGDQASSQYVLGILQATEVYTIGREKRKFQAAKQLRTF
jgi:serine/threonine protein kinase